MIVDITFAAVAGLSFYLGFSRGIIKSVFAIASIVLALLISLKYSFWLIDQLNGLWETNQRVLIVVGFLLTFIAVMLVVRLAGRGLEKVMEAAHINLINKIAGGALSLLIGISLLSSAVWFINRLKLIDAAVKKQSISYPMLEAFPDKMKASMKLAAPLFTEFADRVKKALDEVQEGQPEEPASPSQNL
ncbi:MAG: CvpA family protein [Saprospiraceae bacterium]|nr:CvpA family protein [Saprospiraceae bacterium]